MLGKEWTRTYTLDTNYVKKIQRQWQKDLPAIQMQATFLELWLDDAKKSKTPHDFINNILTARTIISQCYGYYCRPYPDKGYLNNSLVVYSYTPEDKEILDDISRQMKKIDMDADILYQKFRIICYEKDSTMPVQNLYLSL